MQFRVVKVKTGMKPNTADGVKCCVKTRSLMGGRRSQIRQNKRPANIGVKKRESRLECDGEDGGVTAEARIKKLEVRCCETLNKQPL